MHKPAHTWLAAWLLLGQALIASEITPVRRIGSNVTFNLECDRYAEYLIQRSTNLSQWETIRRSFGPSTSRGFQFSSTLPQGFFRALQTNEPIAAMGLVARTTIVLAGSGSEWPWIDSFDSSDTNYSTAGRYDQSKRKDTAFVASLSSAPGCINTGSGEILGSAATAPGGTVIGTVGDGVWCMTMTGIQTNHVRNDFNLTIPNVTLPPASWLPFPVTGTLVNKDYKLTGDLTSGFTVSGKVRVWVVGDVNVRSAGDAIMINNGASLEIFISGASAQIGGQGILNASGSTTNCVIWGLPTCTSLKYSGSVDFVGRIYAPNTAVTLRGGASASGAFTANSFNFSGSSGIHIDEALAR
jgi:choice-of-anchor A domain-containing protein